MITSPTKIKDNHLQIDTIIKLSSAGKKYPFRKTAGASFQEFWALRDVSLEAHSGEVLGVIGRNGAGKTTLLNIIAGVLPTTEGEVLVGGKVLGLFNLGAGFQDELSGRENIFLNGAILGASRRELEERLSAIIEFSELGDFLDMPLGTYSQGMRLRLGFSILVNLDFDILAIDEVLAVGDALFQSKCFARLMDFKRAGKSLIITSQSMELIERLSDRVVVLDHGKPLFSGNTLQGINLYRALLNTEKFFTGPVKKKIALVENTKKWADDKSNWGKEFGTKEVVIDKVEFINKFGFKAKQIKSGAPLKIKVHFTAKNNIKEPHFGVAIFRNDGVYCHGPNTEFDNHKIPEIKKGQGYFVLHYQQISLAAGEYKISVAVWDKNERLAFDYLNGYYSLLVKGASGARGLLNIPFKLRLGRGKGVTLNEGLSPLSVKLLDNQGNEKNIFMTNETMKMNISFSGPLYLGRNYYLRVALYRDDGIYCQGITAPIIKKSSLNIVFRKLPLAPGSYKVSWEIWDNKRDECISRNEVNAFRMVFSRQDHGTVYLEHKWSWKLP